MRWDLFIHWVIGSFFVYFVDFVGLVCFVDLVPPKDGIPGCRLQRIQDSRGRRSAGLRTPSEGRNSKFKIQDSRFNDEDDLYFENLPHRFPEPTSCYYSYKVFEYEYIPP